MNKMILLGTGKYVKRELPIIKRTPNKKKLQKLKKKLPEL